MFFLASSGSDSKRFEVKVTFFSTLKFRDWRATYLKHRLGIISVIFVFGLSAKFGYPQEEHLRQQYIKIFYSLGMNSSLSIVQQTRSLNSQ